MPKTTASAIARPDHVKSLPRTCLLAVIVIEDATSADAMPSFEEIPDRTLYPFPFVLAACRSRAKAAVLASK